jgi:sugar (pentulose or hexulose) kinase
MSEKYVVGVDSGTQSTRAIIFDSKGNKVCKGTAQHPPLISEKQGWHEHEKNDIWNGLCGAAQDAFSQFKGNPADIVGIGVAAQRGTVHFVDKDYNQIHRPVSWMDTRWRMNYDSLGKMPDTVEDPVYRHFYPYYSRANWMKHNNPELYKKIHKYLNASGYLAYRLTGTCRDSCANNLHWPIDMKKWSVSEDDKVFELLGLRRDQIAEMAPPGSLIGKITPEAAKQTGFPEGCAVFTVSGDKQSEVLGAGAVKQGDGYITLGTLCGLNIVSDAYIPSQDVSYINYLSAFPQKYNNETSLTKGFWLVSWFRDNLGGDLANSDASIEASLDKEAEAIPAGSEGLVVLPFWSSPRAIPHAKGLYLGFDDRHTRGHMFRALIEGIVFQLKIGTDKMASAVGIDVEHLYVGGGGSKSDFTIQVIADIFGIPVYRTQEPENCSLGAAVCAAVGSGLYADFTQAIEGMLKKHHIFTPIPEHTRIYQQLREKVIEKLQPCLNEVEKDLGEITKGGK